MVRDAWASDFSFSSVTAISNFSENSGFSFSVGMIETRLALPQRSPRPVERALDLPRARAHGRERVRHSLLGVVVRVDADVVAGHVLHHFADDLLDLVRQRAAVGVAQHHPARARLVRRLGAGERVFRIGLVAVEEVLAVDQHLAALLLGAFTLSRIEARFSSSSSPAPRARGSPRTSPRSRWRSDFASSSVARPGSFEVERPGRRVMPKAVNVAPSLRSCENRSVSVGFAPG
jgi:hypothetical protein